MPETDYAFLQSRLPALLSDESDPLANAANFVALLYQSIDDINWLGIYVLRDNELVLGPFQGQTATTRIALGKGVCGTAAATRQTQRVPDVHNFPGHIVCDIASRSEIVVPLEVDNPVDNTLIGVLDIDSPILDRFSANDQAGIEALCRAYCETLSGADRFL